VQQNCRNAANSNTVVVKLCEPMNDPGVMLLKMNDGLGHPVIKHVGQFGIDLFVKNINLSCQATYRPEMRS
jgi:hypothetical protein